MCANARVNHSHFAEDIDFAFLTASSIGSFAVWLHFFFSDKYRSFFPFFFVFTRLTTTGLDSNQLATSETCENMTTLPISNASKTSEQIPPFDLMSVLNKMNESINHSNLLLALVVQDQRKKNRHAFSDSDSDYKDYEPRPKRKHTATAIRPNESPFDAINIPQNSM